MNREVGRAVWWGLVGTLVGVVAGGISVAAGLERLERMAQEPRVDRVRTSSPSGARNSTSTQAANRPVPPLSIRGCSYPGDDTVTLCLSAPPDMSVFGDYISAPAVKTGLSFAYRERWSCPCEEEPRGRWPRGRWPHYHVEVKGDLPFDTNIVLRVRQGLPAAKGTKGIAPLAVDWTKTLQRKDAPPRVQFLDPGRYLPPGGARMLALDSINVQKIHCAAAAIPTANIVQLLARENEAYVRAYVDTRSHDDSVVDSEATESLADRLVEWDVETAGRRNEHRVSQFALRTLPDAASNGVFLVAIRSADLPRDDSSWWWYDEQRGEKWNPNRYRLVCVTDVGLTVRREGRDLLVWATSLMSGEPVASCDIEVYGSNNRRLAMARTDDTGLCRLACGGTADPFAVIARTADGKDTSFVCLRDCQTIAEGETDGKRERFLKPTDVQAFVWTERNIYRHDEPIFAHALLRNGQHRAPLPLPVEFCLLDPDGNAFLRKTVVTDANGAAMCDALTVPAERPSGRWQIQVCLPGEQPTVLGGKAFSVEEFAPPQIRVSAEPEGEWATNFAFAVKAEHLYGGPARSLRCTGAVVFEDLAFAPSAWNGWQFGDDRLGLNPNYRRLEKSALDEQGTYVFAAPLFAESGKPKAAVRAIGEGTVFEDGGRPARARTTKTLHYYPFYVGTTLGGNVRIPETGFARVKVACVKPDGSRLAEARKLKLSFARIDSVYSCQMDRRGWMSWHCERLDVPQKVEVEELETKADGDVEMEIPFRADGDYRLTLTEAETGVAFSRTFWLGSRGDDAVRAPMAKPSEVTLSFDKASYRPGDVPRLLVKAPFAGWALLTTMRERIVSSRVLKLEGPTQEIALDPVVAAWAPNLEVSVSVVQSAANDGRHQTARAHGRATLVVRPPEQEIPVSVKTDHVRSGQGGGTLAVDVTALHAAATGTVAVVTVVDEGIHLLGGWNPLAPDEYLNRPRREPMPLFDLFDNLLPVWDGDPMKTRGVKTGGGFGAALLGRVSPVPTRRFKLLAQWQANVPLTNGVGHVVFELPEFAGEVRVTAVAYSSTAVGAADRCQKIAPKLVLQPDAPRFAAPGDLFDATVTLANRGEAAGDVNWTLVATGAVVVAGSPDAVRKGLEPLAKDASATRTIRLKAGDRIGEGVLTFTVEGLGEKHVQTIALPVRPAVASREKSGTIALEPGVSRTFDVSRDGTLPAAAVRVFKADGSELAKLLGALTYLAEYPHGCLEQTTSQIFPLVVADGFLNRLTPAVMDGRLATNRMAYVEAGVRRVASMLRSHDFVMWPDCNSAPWTREVSVYAANFLLTAERSGVKLPPGIRERILGLLQTWSRDKNLTVSAAACEALALAGAPEKDRMLVLYDRRKELDGIGQARLSRAFLGTKDRMRATEMIRAFTSQAQSVKEAAVVLQALLDVDPADARIAPLVRYLEQHRDAARFSWGTTEENAAALCALGSYYRYHPATEGKPELALKRGTEAEQPLSVKKGVTVRGAETVTIRNAGTGTAWLTWRTVDLPKAETVTNATSRIKIERRLLTPEGRPVDLAKIARGDLIFVELTVGSDLTVGSAATRTYNDLVIQDLFPAACEPVLGGDGPAFAPQAAQKASEWVMRADARDDRMLVFSKKFELKADEPKRFYYSLRVVSSGDFTLPGPTVEAMYAPEIYSVVAPSRFVVEH